MRIRELALLAVAPALALIPGGTGRFDAVKDFTVVENPAPDGVWAYGWESPLNGYFHPFQQAADLPFLGGRIIGWSMAPGVPEPQAGAFVVRNLSGKTLRFRSRYFPADRLALFPGTSGQYCIARWTAPLTGVYSLEARFEGLDYGDTDVRILQNDIEIASEGIATRGVCHDFSFSKIPMQAGQHLDFAVGYGHDRSHDNDFTGLSAVVNLLRGAPGI